MTVLVATLSGLWADKKISCDSGSVCDPITKIASNDYLVAAFAGGYEGILKALDNVRQGCPSPEELAQMMPAACTGLAVFQGRIYWLDTRRAWKRRKGAAFCADGSGGPEAFAFLSGRGKVRDQDVRAAIRYVSRVRDDCGRGIDFIAAP